MTYMLTPILSSLFTGDYLLVCALEAPELGPGNVGDPGTRFFQVIAAPPPARKPPPPPAKKKPPPPLQKKPPPPKPVTPAT